MEMLNSEEINRLKIEFKNIHDAFDLRKCIITVHEYFRSTASFVDGWLIDVADVREFNSYIHNRDNKPVIVYVLLSSESGNVSIYSSQDYKYSNVEGNNITTVFFKAPFVKVHDMLCFVMDEIPMYLEKSGY